MATIKRALSAKTNPSGRAEIMLRVSVSHSVSHRIKSGLFIKKELFKDNKFSNPRDPELKKEVRDIQDRLDEIEKFLIRICEDTPLNKVDEGPSFSRSWTCSLIPLWRTRQLRPK